MNAVIAQASGSKTFSCLMSSAMYIGIAIEQYKRSQNARFNTKATVDPFKLNLEETF